MNWKVRKPDCFNMDKWLEEFLCLISMEKGGFRTDGSEQEGGWLMGNNKKCNFITAIFTSPIITYGSSQRPGHTYLFMCSFV